jgi:translation initiation factor IF-3
LFARVPFHNIDGLLRVFLPAVFYFIRRCIPINTEVMINEEIRDPEVRVIDSDGTQLGIMSSQAALTLAEQKEMDLVKIAAMSKPPVCKIMDYGKYRFEQDKREKEARKNQKVITVKELRLSPVIEEHDVGVRVKNCLKFLADGNKVKVTIRFRGRMLSHSELGLDVMKDFFGRVDDFAVMDKKPVMEGRTMSMMLSPKKQ